LSNFRAANSSPTMLGDLILHSKRHFVPPKTIGINQSPCYESLRGMIRQTEKSLVFTAIKSEYLRRFRPRRTDSPRNEPLGAPVLCLPELLIRCQQYLGHYTEVKGLSVSISFAHTKSSAVHA